MKKLLTLFLVFSLIGCKTASIVKSKTNTQLHFLDEFVLPDTLMVNGTIVGGLSGIDCQNGMYYLVCDDAFDARYYTANIHIENNTIADIKFTDVFKIKDSVHFLDLESIRFDPITKKVMITSEGSIKRGKDPLLFSVNPSGEITTVKIPDELLANSPQKPRNNGTLEGFCVSYDEKGYWIAMELPLEADGPEPAFENANSPVRITYIDAKLQQPTRQFAYYLEPIIKEPRGDFAVNGLTDILQYEKDKFFVIERAYSSGWGTQGNTVKIFRVDISDASNTLNSNSLKDEMYVSAHKELLFDLETIRGQLTENIIDNIEGISFGPLLPNGNKSLILVADNNFNQLGEQINQFILFEIVD
ncbi:MAG: esterase-like activity of phytase family protein [Flavobacteriaceae bacterium]